MSKAIMLLLGLWVAIWAVTAGTWKYDAQGYSTGTSLAILCLHGLVPVFAAVLTSRRLRDCVVAAVAVALADLGVFVLWDWLLHVLGKVKPAAPHMRHDSGWIHVLEFAILFSLVALVLGLGVRLGRRMLERA